MRNFDLIIEVENWEYGLILIIDGFDRIVLIDGSKLIFVKKKRKEIDFLRIWILDDLFN